MDYKIDKLVQKYNLNLSELVVLTEGASGAYLLNPFVALAAGAKQVICRLKDSRFANAKTVKEDMLSKAKLWNYEDRLVVKDTLENKDYGSADIITNSGHLRPISREHIASMKKTAVIPLMWETWEFHDGYLDIKACKENNILVMGTNESRPPCDMKNYGAAVGLKLLFETGVEIAGSNILMLGSTETLCIPIKKAIEHLGGNVTLFSHANSMLSEHHYSNLKPYLEEKAREIDAILLTEHKHDDKLFSRDVGMPFSDLSKKNQELKIAISCGNIDVEDLKNSQLHYYPKYIEPFGYMSYQSYHLGPFPVMDLFAAGLKVGEVMAKARLAGMTVQESAIYALKESPAEDFEGDLSWS